MQSSLVQCRSKEAFVPYVDAFVVAVQRPNLETYKAMARAAGEVWKEFGALAYVECIGDDVPHGEGNRVSLLQPTKRRTSK